MIIVAASVYTQRKDVVPSIIAISLLHLRILVLFVIYFFIIFLVCHSIAKVRYHEIFE